MEMEKEINLYGTDLLFGKLFFDEYPNGLKVGVILNPLINDIIVFTNMQSGKEYFAQYQIGFTDKDIEHFSITFDSHKDYFPKGNNHRGRLIFRLKKNKKFLFYFRE